MLTEPALLRAEILRAYRRCTNARERGEELLAQTAEDEMNQLLDLLPLQQTALEGSTTADDHPR